MSTPAPTAAPSSGAPSAPPGGSTPPSRGGATPPRGGATPPRGGATPPRGGATAASTLELIERSRGSLLEACHSRAVAERYQQAQLAAMRAAAALVSARAATTGTSGLEAGPRSLWALLPSVAPELTEWAGFFEVAALRHDHAPAVSAPPSPGPVTPREADDLLRQAETFVDLVCRALGLPVTPAHGDVLVPTAWA